jgi:hypothetical protein
MIILLLKSARNRRIFSPTYKSACSMIVFQRKVIAVGQHQPVSPAIRSGQEHTLGGKVQTRKYPESGPRTIHGSAQQGVWRGRRSFLESPGRITQEHIV